MGRTLARLAAPALAALATCAAPALAQVIDPDDDIGGPVILEAAPRLTFINTEVDFGRLTDEATVSTSFSFRNDGAAPLEIVNIRAGCGCTVPKLEKTTYAPGEGGAIEVVFDPSKKRGLTRQRITVQSNDPDRPSRVLQVAADVVKLVEFNPSAIHLQRVYRGEESVLRMQVTGRSENFEITDLQLTGDYIEGVSVTMGNFRPLIIDNEPATTGEILVTVAADAKPGLRQGQLVVRTNDPRKSLINLTVMGEVIGDLGANPQRVSLGGLEGGKLYERRLTIRSRTGQSFDITDVQWKGQGELGVQYSIEPDLRNPADKILVLNLTAPERRGIVRGNLVLTTTVTDEETLEIPVSGAVRR